MQNVPTREPLNSASSVDDSGIKLAKQLSYATMAQSDEDPESNDSVKPSSAEAPLMENQQRSTSPREILDSIYDEVIDSEAPEEEPQQTQAAEATKQRKSDSTVNVPQTETQTNETKRPETNTAETKGENEVHKIEITTIKKKDEPPKKRQLDIMQNIHTHKSVLDTTMNHAERIDSVWDFIDLRIILQVGIAWIIALSTFYIEFGIWRVLHISHCSEHIVFLSWNSLKSAIYDMWQYGFCVIMADIYLLTASIIDHDAVAEFGIFDIPMRKLRRVLIAATMIIAFIVSFFISHYNELTYNLRLPTFIAACILFYYLILFRFRKIVTKQSWYILWPFAAYVAVIVIVYNVGVLIAWFFRGNGIAFAAVYPIYIGIAQTMGMLAMKYYHYFLCLFCKEKYAVAKDYDPNSYFVPPQITQRYICTDAGGNIESEADLEEDLVDGRAVEYLWIDEWLYFICGCMIVFTESMRISGLLAVKDDTAGIIISCVSALIMEVLQRNNLVWELLYSCVWKKPNPDRTKFDAVYYGAKYSWEYLPVLILMQMNIIQFGPSTANEDCYKTGGLNQVYDLRGGYTWIALTILGFELLTDVVCEVTNWILRRYAIIPVDAKQDGARKVILIRLGLYGWSAVFISAIQIAQIGYSVDYALYNMLNNDDWQMVNAYAGFFARFF